MMQGNNVIQIDIKVMKIGSGINTAGWWSRWILWHLPTLSTSYQDMKKDLIYNINIF